MPRKAAMTKQQIIEAAFELAKENGKQSITIREIGNHLGKSTAPIYTQYESIDDIMVDLTAHVHHVFHEYTMTKHSGDTFLDIGLGYISFVMEFTRIYTDFYLSTARPAFTANNDDELFIEQMKKVPMLSVLDDDRLRQLLDDMAIYTYGLAVMICADIGPKNDFAFYRNKLEQAGHRFISYHLYSSGQYENAVKKLSENR